MRLRAAVRLRKRKWIFFGLVILLAAAVFAFVQERKEFLVRQAVYGLKKVLSHQSRFDVVIGRIRGKLLGEIIFDNVRVLSPGVVSDENREVFRAKKIILRYRLLDFLSKKFDARLVVDIEEPTIRWRPGARPSLGRGSPWIRWLKEWVIGQRRSLSVRVRHLTVNFNSQKTVFNGINAGYENEIFSLEVPIRHATVGETDVSTTIKAYGKMNLGYFGGPDSLEGDLFTEGTVINWSPLPKESQFEFKMTSRMLTIRSAQVLGGVAMEGSIDFDQGGDIRWQWHAEDYPLSNLDLLFKTVSRAQLPEKMDLDLLFQGSLWAPRVEGRTRIYGGRAGKSMYKAMDIQVEGVYPTVRMSNSRVLMADGSVMKFADVTLEFWELFKSKTYSDLVGGAAQETVVWGEWEFHRHKDIHDQAGFQLERSLGESASVHLREYKSGEPSLDKPEDAQVQVGVEYKLPEQSALKLELRENEEAFVGIERKTKF